jgi:hypothetical protein
MMSLAASLVELLMIELQWSLIQAVQNDFAQAWETGA